jgi:hypothetical protein
MFFACAELPCTTRQLTERSAGYALLKSKDKKLFDKSDESKDASTLVDSLKLKKFQKFENAVTALNEAAALTDGKVSSMLSNLLEELKDETKASRMYAPHHMRAIVLTTASGRR